MTIRFFRSDSFNNSAIDCSDQSRYFAFDTEATDDDLDGVISAVTTIARLNDPLSRSKQRNTTSPPWVLRFEPQQ